MLIHDINPESMLLGTMVPIPKHKRQSLCNSDNYRAITLSNIIGKIQNWIILIKEEQSLSSSSLLFGFKGGKSTTQSTFILNETVSYYNFNHTNVYAVFLNASKAFDHVQYCKLFNELVNHNISPVVLRLLLNMYTKHKLQVRWGNAMSQQFTLCNGVKQGGFSHLYYLLCILMDCCLDLTKVGLEVTWVIAIFGVWVMLMMSNYFVVIEMVDMCVDYADEYNIKFNGSKNFIIIFKGRQCKDSQRTLIIDEVTIHCSGSVSDLGHKRSIFILL